MRLNPVHTWEVTKFINATGYFKLLPISARELGIGQSVVVMELEAKHINPFGGITAVLILLGSIRRPIGFCTGTWLWAPAPLPPKFIDSYVFLGLSRS